jgi:hypothetical protein
MAGRNRKTAVTYVATAAAVGCLYGCGDVPSGNGASKLAATAAGRYVTGPFRAVRVGTAGQTRVAATLTSGRSIASVTTLLSSLHPAPRGARTCALPATYVLTLLPASSRGPAVGAEAGGCGVDRLLVGGHPRAVLRDPGSRLYLLARALLRPYVRTGQPILPQCHISPPQAGPSAPDGQETAAGQPAQPCAAPHSLGPPDPAGAGS